MKAIVSTLICGSALLVASTVLAADHLSQPLTLLNRWRWRQSSANPSPFGIPCFAGKYREILPLEVGAADSARHEPTNPKRFLKIP